MNDAPRAERESSPYLRLPLPVVATGVLVFLALLLAIGLYANANLRPQGTLIPTPVAQATQSRTAVPIAAPPPTALLTGTDAPVEAPQPVAIAPATPAVPSAPTSRPEPPNAP